MKHRWKVYLTVITGEPAEREISCEVCGYVLTYDNEDEECEGDDGL